MVPGDGVEQGGHGVDPALERLKQQVVYVPATGRFLDRATGSKATPGATTLCLGGKSYLRGRVAWLCHFGQWPRGRVVHRNGDPSDNRICNLMVRGR